MPGGPQTGAIKLLKNAILTPLHLVRLAQADIVDIAAESLAENALGLVVTVLGRRTVTTDVAAPIIAAGLALAVGDADLLHAAIDKEVRHPSAMPEGPHVCTVLKEDIAIFAPDHGIPLAGRHLTVATASALPLADVVDTLSASGAGPAGATTAIVAALLAGTTGHTLALTIIWELLRALCLLGNAVVKVEHVVPAALLLGRIDQALAIEEPEHSVVAPQQHIVLATALEDDVAARPLTAAFAVQTLLANRADSARAAASIGAALKPGAIRNTLPMFETAEVVKGRQPLAGDILAHRFTVGDIDFTVDAGDETVAVAPSLLIKPVATITRGDALPRFGAGLPIGTVATAATAAIGTAHLALTIRSHTIGDALPLGRAPCPGGTFAAGPAATVGAAFLVATDGGANEFALIFEALLPRKAIAAGTAAAVIATVLADADRHARLITLEVLAPVPEGTSSARATAAVIAAILSLTLGDADGTKPLGTTTLPRGALPTESVAAVRPALLVGAFWFADGTALVVLGALCAVGTVTTSAAAAVITAELALAPGKTATAAVGKADFLAIALAAATATPIVTAALVDAVRNTDIRRLRGIVSIRMQATILGYCVG